MEISNIDKAVTTPRIKRKFSLEAQKEFCHKWKESGLEKREFCKRHNIGASAFYNWCKKILPAINNQEGSNWSPVISAQRKPALEEEQALIELSLPNHIVARVKIATSKVASFIQELCHAVAIIR